MPLLLACIRPTTVRHFNLPKRYLFFPYSQRVLYDYWMVQNVADACTGQGYEGGKQDAKKGRDPDLERLN